MLLHKERICEDLRISLQLDPSPMTSSASTRKESWVFVLIYFFVEAEKLNLSQTKTQFLPNKDPP